MFNDTVHHRLYNGGQLEFVSNILITFPANGTDDWLAWPAFSHRSNADWVQQVHANGGAVEQQAFALHMSDPRLRHGVRYPTQSALSDSVRWWDPMRPVVYQIRTRSW